MLHSIVFKMMCIKLEIRQVPNKWFCCYYLLRAY